MEFLDLENLFQRPEWIEDHIVRIIRCRDRDLRDRALDYLTSIIGSSGLSLYPESVFVKKNISNIIDIIWKNNWEAEGWNNEEIYSEDFKRICRMTFFVPFIYMDLLSGEYIMYLIHPDIRFDYRVTCPEIEEGENEISHKKRCNAEILKRKNENVLKWAKSFENIFGISMEKYFPEDTERGRKRKGTIGYKLFEEYGYAVYEINKVAGRPMNLLKIYSEPFVNHVVRLYMGADVNMLESCDGVILFKTMLFQNLHNQEEIRNCMARFTVDIHRMIKLMRDVKTCFRKYLTAMIKNMNSGVVGEKKEASREMVEDNIQSIIEKLKLMPLIMRDGDDMAVLSKIMTEQSVIDGSDKLKGRDCDIYKTVLWKMILIEINAVINTLKNTYVVKIMDNDRLENLHQYIRRNPRNKMMTKNWKTFNNLYKEQLSELFPGYKENILKDLWLIAIKTIAYCDFAKFPISSDEVIPKKIDKKWLKNKNVEYLPVGGVFATMVLLENARMYKVQLKENKIWLENNEVDRIKIYHNLMKEAVKDKDTTLYSVLKNLVKEKCTAALVLQVRQLTREYVSSHYLTVKEIMKLRKMQLELWNVYDICVNKAESFDMCRRHTVVMTRNFENIMMELNRKIVSLTT